MEVIINILVVITLVQVWTRFAPDMLGRELIPFKPFNCSTCLSWWLGVILAILTQEIYFLTIVLCNEVYESYS